jgi:lactoylglutathione lyase
MVCGGRRARFHEAVWLESALPEAMPSYQDALRNVSVQPPLLNLVVIRSADLDRAERFYRVLGLHFERHRHGTGPEHLAAQPYEGGYVFEVYPASVKAGSTTGVRIGFSVDAVDVYLDQLVEAGGTIVQAPADSEWGRRAVVADPDGHRVELVMHAVSGI